MTLLIRIYLYDFTYMTLLIWIYLYDFTYMTILIWIYLYDFTYMTVFVAVHVPPPPPSLFWYCGLSLQLMEEDELFNPEYVEVDRVLGVSRFPPAEDSDEPEAVYYLVKWRQLPYEDATWELEVDVDKTMIAKYLQYSEPPETFKVRAIWLIVSRNLVCRIHRPSNTYIKRPAHEHKKTLAKHRLEKNL